MSIGERSERSCVIPVGTGRDGLVELSRSGLVLQYHHHGQFRDPNRRRGIRRAGGASAL